MKINFRSCNYLTIITFTAALAIAQSTYSATLYVDTLSSSASSPFSSWGTAATTIQDAVNAANSGDVVLVASGSYVTGSMATPGSTIASRLVITKDITVKSVAGAKVTTIRGAGDAGGTLGLGPAAIRCIYMSSGVLEGFTLENGHTNIGSGPSDDKNLSGGGAILEQGGIITNCIFTGNRAGNTGGGAFLLRGGQIIDSEITGNFADRFGGGACLYAGGTIVGCSITSNTAINNYGGGIFCNYSGGIVRDCLLLNNSASLGGGGIYFVNGLSKIFNSKILNNTAGFAGGICFRYSGEAHSCLVANNSASSTGGGVSFYDGGKLYNCTITDNTASNDSNGGGIYLIRGAYIHNCIIWGNSAKNEVYIFDDSSQTISIRNTCASEGVTDGVNGCIIADPSFVNAPYGIYRLTSNSPCIDMGNNSYQTTTEDVESQPRLLDGNADDIAHIDIGAHEFMSDSTDTDADGMSDWNEYIADTDATDIHSLFRVENVTNTNGDVSVSFYASRNRIYTVQFCENLSVGSWEDLPNLTQLADLNGLCELSDTNSARNTGFYKVKVALP